MSTKTHKKIIAFVLVVDLLRGGEGNKQARKHFFNVYALLLILLFEYLKIVWCIIKYFFNKTWIYKILWKSKYDDIKDDFLLNFKWIQHLIKVKFNIIQDREERGVLKITRCLI